jgi:cytochrome oxidase Cu insertion factor (SCO1/SenC/PrrC family)
VQRIYRAGKLSLVVTAGLLVLTTAGAAVVLAANGAGSVASPPVSIRDQMDRSLPDGLRDTTFTDQEGQPVSLEHFAGRVELLVPFLTSCQEERPAPRVRSWSLSGRWWRTASV